MRETEIEPDDKFVGGGDKNNEKQKKRIVIKNKLLFLSALCVLSFAICAQSARAANVVQRGGGAAKAAAAPARARPVATAAAPIAAAAPAAVAEVAEEPVVEEVAEEAPIVDSDRIGKFSAAVESGGGASAASANDSDLKKLIQQQRNADAASMIAASASASSTAATASGRNACDDGLRTCMKDKCGDKFEKCAIDSDLVWGDKMESCRRTAKCSGEEYGLFAPEIKADRDVESSLASWREVINCGGEYNDCMVGACGEKFEKCLGKKSSDKAVADCKKIAESCKSAESGLAGRWMEVFGNLRQDAEVQVKKDEKELYALRDKMSAQCKTLNALFDDRSFDCLFSIDFFAGDSEGPMATRKGYAGSKFDCTQDWFGVDVTTYIENMKRRDRELQGASSAMLGAGVGTLAGVGLNQIMKGGAGKTNQQDDAEKAKDAYSSECDAQGGLMKLGKCCTTDKCKEEAEEKAKENLTNSGGGGGKRGMIFEEGTGGYMGPSACAPGAGADACDRWKAENPDKEIDRNTGKTKDKSFDDMAGRGPLAPQETDDKKPAGSGISDIPGMPSKEKSSSPGSGVLKPEAKEKPDK